MYHQGDVQVDTTINFDTGGQQEWCNKEDKWAYVRHKQDNKEDRKRRRQEKIDCQKVGLSIAQLFCHGTQPNKEQHEENDLNCGVLY